MTGLYWSNIPTQHLPFRQPLYMTTGVEFTDKDSMINDFLIFRLVTFGIGYLTGALEQLVNCLGDSPLDPA